MTLATGPTASRLGSPALPSASSLTLASTPRSTRTASPRWRPPRNFWSMPAPTWNKPTPACPIPASSSAACGVPHLARLVANTPTQLAGLLDPGIREVSQALGGMTAIEFMDAEATRATAAHAMARLHQRYDLVLCPTVPAGPPLADAPTLDPVRALWTRLGAMDLHLQPDPPARDFCPNGAASGRDAELGANRGGTISRRSRAPRRPGDRDGTAVPTRGSEMNMGRRVAI